MILRVKADTLLKSLLVHTRKVTVSTSNKTPAGIENNTTFRSKALSASY